ncbi:MAG: MoxR family ATPase [Chromatiales bacterium]|nr:MoxR family ATPase [Chromatiales bacterium]
MTLPATVDETVSRLAQGDYVAERSLATAVFLTLKMRRPLFLEGEAGVGKTEVARVLAGVLGRRLVRLQCYEGLDVASAVYEWNYPRQMIRIRLAEAAGREPGASATSMESLEEDIFSRRFLIERPLLDALTPDPAGAPVLLIDELDRADEPFEAYLLELLADFQITIPELGTIAASEPPVVVITSNRTREIHDAIKRRCYYHWVDYPDAARELEILRVRAPGTAEALSREVVAFVQSLREMDLFKAPGVAETIDWAQALTQLDVLALSPDVVNDTLGSLLKYQDDIARIRGSEAAGIIEQLKREMQTAGAV